MTNAGTGPDERVLRLMGAARGLEDEGRYNQAKLFRAVAYGELARATVTHPKATGGLPAVIDSIVADLRSGGHDEALLALMLETAEELRSGKQRVDLGVERVWVCRNCGQVARVAAPASCTGCGAGALSLWEILPIHYLEALPAETVLRELTAMPDRVASTCAGLDEQRASAGEWPACDIVAHLLGAERLLGGRARRMLDEDDPLLVAVASGDVVVKEAPSLPVLLSQYRQAREGTVEHFRSLRPEKWLRTGRHPEWGRISVVQQLSYLARHEHSHLADLQRAVTRASP